ncbi:MAG: glycosyltransferase family 2 protein [Candidatus Omnitrophota bacterium]
MKISVIVTALNEERNIVSAIKNILTALEGLHQEGEIVVVNDGSTDQTEELILSLIREHKNIRLLRHERPQGVGFSFWDGVDACTGDAVVWMPGDNENDPREIFRYFHLLDHVDIIIPFIFNKEVRSRLRNVLSSIFRLIINTTFGVNFNYTNGTILYRKSILKGIRHKNDGFFFHADILIRAAQKGYLFAEVPCRLNTRERGVSKALTLSSLARVARGYFGLVRDLYFRKDPKANLGFPPDSLTRARREDKFSP